MFCLMTADTIPFEFRAVLGAEKVKGRKKNAPIEIRISHFRMIGILANMTNIHTAIQVRNGTLTNKMGLR